MRKAQYKTLVDYMERTNTNRTRLLELANQRLRRKMSRSLFSAILCGSRRCSGENAWALHNITGVSMEELTRWPRYAKTENSQASAKDDHDQFGT